jgi:hypothetical protein
MATQPSPKTAELSSEVSRKGDKAIVQTGELTSQVLTNANPFEVISKYNPAEQSTAVLVEINQMIGTSFKEFFAKAAPWILELKNDRFEVRPGSKGVQIEINGIPTYWHEFFGRTFSITRRHFQQLEKQVAEGTWQRPPLKEGDRVQVEVEGKDKEGRVLKVHETAEKIDVQPLAEANEPLGKTYDVITLDFEDVEKVKPAKITKVTTGQLLMLTDVDGGTEYRYEGGGKIKRTGKPSANAQRKAKAEAAEKLREAKEKEKREKGEQAQREKQAEAVRGAGAAVKEQERMLEEQKQMLKNGAIPTGLIATKGQGVRKTKKSAHGFFAYWDKRKVMKGHAPWCVVNEKDEKDIFDTCYTEQDALNSVKQRDDGMVVKEAVRVRHHRNSI